MASFLPSSIPLLVSLKRKMKQTSKKVFYLYVKNCQYHEGNLIFSQPEDQPAQPDIIQ